MTGSATKQSRLPWTLDCFAPLAMTISASYDYIRITAWLLILPVPLFGNAS
jgi:hypothetical protein